MISWLFIEFLGHIATWSTTNDDGSEIAATILETKILIKILPSLLDNMTTNLSSCSVILLSKTWESVIVLLSCAHGPNCCLSSTEKRKDVDPLACVVKRDHLQRKQNWKQEAIHIEQSI